MNVAADCCEAAPPNASRTQDKAPFAQSATDDRINGARKGDYRVRKK
jgi:hypothetical protein